MEFKIFHRKPFVWIYLSIGLYEEKWRRIAFDFYLEFRNRVHGFGFEKVFEELENEN